MQNASSNSSLTQSSLSGRLAEWCVHFGMRVQGLMSTPDFRHVFDPIAEYDALLQQYSGKSLSQSTVLEAGFGARPVRLIAMTSMGIDARGVDLDAPILDGSLAEFRGLLRKNGAQRLVKSVVRHFLFDWHERKHLRHALVERGFQFKIDRDRFVVADVGSDELAARMAPASLDLICSEDVFEHIPPRFLEPAVRNMARWLKPDGIAAIRPLVFTGICGGHSVDWYPHQVDLPMHRQSEPWEHLRRDRFPANTYLNRLRVRDFRALFAPHFEILREQRTDPDIGLGYLTPEIERELSEYSREELLTNHVMFVLRPKTS